jgi:hypothetical protein
LIDFHKHKGFFKKYFGKAALLLFLVVVLNIYREYNSRNVYFDHSGNVNNIRIVEEEGQIEYSSSETVEFHNSYIVNEIVERNGAIVSVSGDMEGEIDSSLAMFINDRFFNSKIDLHDSNSICNEYLNPFYPVLIRRLNYYMPQTELFDNKKWKYSFCSGSFVCDYSLTMKGKNPPEISYFCSGDIDEN